MDLIGDPKKLADAFEPMIEKVVRNTLDGATVKIVEGGFQLVLPPPPKA
jgi:hypothetical protein